MSSICRHSCLKVEPGLLELLTGSTINWKSIRPAGGTEEKAVKEKVAAAQAEEDDAFKDIPF